MFEKKRRKVIIWDRIRYVDLFERLKGKRGKKYIKEEWKKR